MMTWTQGQVGHLTFSLYWSLMRLVAVNACAFEALLQDVLYTCAVALMVESGLCSGMSPTQSAAWHIVVVYVDLFFSTCHGARRRRRTHTIFGARGG